MYYNRNAAINQFLYMLFCTRRESKLCLTGKMEKCIIPSVYYRNNSEAWNGKVRRK